MADNLSRQKTQPRLLLVEDDRLCLATLHSGLKELGFQPVNAISGNEAMELCRRQTMDLALLDIGLPDMCGLELGRHLHETYRMPIIYLTGDHSCTYIDKATHGGAFGYLVKPLQVEQIAPMIYTTLRRAQEMEALQQQGTHLKRAIDQDRCVNLCVGVIMAHYHLDSDQAYRFLRQYARSNRRKLVEVAASYIQAMDKVNQLTPPLSGDRKTPANSVSIKKRVQGADK